MRILYIEDDRRLSATLGEFFKLTRGWSIVPAYGPAEAIKLLEQHIDTIDAIVLDIMMPPDEQVDNKKSNYGQDTGILLLEQIHPIIGGRIPVIVLSARQNLGWLEDEGRVAKYIRKTISPEAIVDEISEGVKAFEELGTGG